MVKGLALCCCGDGLPLSCYGNETTMLLWGRDCQCFTLSL